ncbi:recombinase family protein, partial [Nocardia noduli]|uniref:recombinase family protein n=1 Tax=Nocardia noduli TaxID=2815722 RepID=UPI001C244644
GQTKTLLVINPDTAPTIRQIFTWRITEQLGYTRISDRLNNDPVRYPSATGAPWGSSTVSHILHNPKYTGYQVYNRTRNKTRLHTSKTRPATEWIWSPQPVHPAIITIDEFTAAQTIAPGRERSRSDPYPGAPNPRAKRVYKLRSYITCVTCGYRMCGKADGGARIYYACQPKTQAARPQNHPNTICLPEKEILTAITKFFNEHVFGTDRQALFLATSETGDTAAAEEHQAEIDAAQHAIERIDTTRERLYRNLGIFDYTTDRGAIENIRQQLRNLDTQHHNTTTRLTELHKQQPPQPAQNLDLLERLPTTEIDLTQLPTPLLRQLLDAFHFTATYDKTSHHAHFTITLTNPTIEHINHLTNTIKNTQKPPPPAETPQSRNLTSATNTGRQGHHRPARPARRDQLPALRGPDPIRPRRGLAAPGRPTARPGRARRTRRDRRHRRAGAQRGRVDRGLFAAAHPGDP